jgi:hypothetical protein
MLSYAKHGKFPALTQAAQPKSRRKKRSSRSNEITVDPVPHLQWIMRWTGPQIRTVHVFWRSGQTERMPVRCCAGAALRPVEKQRRTTCAVRHRGPRGFLSMNFANDNTAPVAPAILDALAEASRGYARWTKAAERQFCEIFEREVAAFLVPTSTAANALALAQVSPPWGATLPQPIAHSHRRMRCARILRTRRQARRPLRRGRKDYSGRIARGARRIWRT